MDKTTFKVLLEKVRPLIERDRIPNFGKPYLFSNFDGL
jgi:hypothetical protein